jgi:hypothetical protein
MSGPGIGYAYETAPPRARLRRIGHPRRDGLVSVVLTTHLSVMTGIAIPPGHRIYSSSRDKVPTVRKHRDESLACPTQARMGCGHASRLAACFSAVHQPGLEAGKHPIWVFPLSHKMTRSLFQTVHSHPLSTGVGCALASRRFPGTNSSGFPGPSFVPCPDCRTPRPA